MDLGLPTSRMQRTSRLRLGCKRNITGARLRLGCKRNITGAGSVSRNVSRPCLGYVEEPINHWLHWDDWRFARFAGYADSFLILSPGHFGTGVGPCAVPLGAGYFRSPQL